MLDPIWLCCQEFKKKVSEKVGSGQGQVASYILVAATQIWANIEKEKIKINLKLQY